MASNSDLKRMWLIGIAGPNVRRLTMGLALLVALACSKKSDEASKPPLTQAQRDSAIAASKLPGAGVVGRALEVADSAEARSKEPIPEP